MSWEKELPGGFVLSDDTARLDLEALLRFFREESYWGQDRDRPTLERAIANSLAIGLYAPGGGQAGFARAISDRTLRAHLADVVVLAPYRGRGLGTALVGGLLEHPELATVRMWTLGTRDAQAFYARFGFGPHPNPERQMVRKHP